jgi:hypothetical protein
MKTKITILLLAVNCVLLSCNTQPPTLDVDMVIQFDMTDKVTMFPSADDFLSQLNLKDHPFQSIRIKVTSISDKDVNTTTLLILDKENEWESNITIRKAKIRHFRAQLQRCLTTIQQTDTSGHSIIYRPIIAQANRLASSGAKRRLLIVYSNLYENSDINFYNPSIIAMLKSNPKNIQERLEQQVALQPLNGIGVWLIYNPTSYRDNNHFRPIANLYETILLEHGASVHVDNKFLLQ